jgi:hypothetical protein
LWLLPSSWLFLPLLLGWLKGCILLGFEHEFIFDVDLDVLVFVSGEREVIPFPLPFEFSFASIFSTVEHTPGANSVIDDCHRLKSISQDDVRVHGSNIQMVDQGFLLEGTSSINQLTELYSDFSSTPLFLERVYLALLDHGHEVYELFCTALK